MGEPKPFASLSSGLLARKGAARPAMRRPDPLSAARIDSLTHGNVAMTMPADDLGWNDMGYDVDPARLDGPVSDVRRPRLGALAVEDMRAPAEEQDDTPVEEVAPAVLAPAPLATEPFDPVELDAPAVDPAAAVATTVPAAATPRQPAKPRQRQAKAAFTLRLDPERHLRLRLACAVRHVSAQVLVTEALEAYLATIPQVAALADQARDDNNPPAAPRRK